MKRTGELQRGEPPIHDSLPEPEPDPHRPTRQLHESILEALELDRFAVGVDTVTQLIDALEELDDAVARGRRESIVTSRESMASTIQSLE